MVGIVFFRRVVLEGEQDLAAKVEQLDELVVGLGWPRGQSQLLAAGLEANAKVMLAALHQAARSGGELRANFQVRRSGGNAFWDAMQQASESGLLPQDGAPQRCYKVFPSFVDEWSSAADGGPAAKKIKVEAGEGHGPRKEFFCLAAASMTGQQQQADGGTSASSQQNKPVLFTFNRSAGAYWYNTLLVPSPELVSAYRFSGWLIAQSLLNKAPLGIPLAPALLKQLLLPGGIDDFRPGLDALEAFDPQAAAAVRQVSALPPKDLKDMMQAEGLPAGTTAEQYAAHSARSILVDAVEWQARALASGFRVALDPKVLRAWCVDELALAAVLDDGGSGALEDFDVRRVFRVVMDQELTKDEGVLGGRLACNSASMFVDVSPLHPPTSGDTLWKVVDAWPRDRKQQFLAFVTGSSRLPLPGSELLKVESPFVALGAAENRAQLGMLPQAHTCDNLLEVPNYWAALLQTKGYRNSSQVPKDQIAVLQEECARIMDDRLTLAITCCAGYGLDRRSGDGDED